MKIDPLTLYHLRLPLVFSNDIGVDDRDDGGEIIQTIHSNINHCH